MDLRPGALLGLPPGVPSVVLDVAYWRDLLVLLALAVGWFVARRRLGWALALSIAWTVLAIGFWVVALGRPYGVFHDEGITRWAAEVSIAEDAPGDDGLVAGEKARHGWSQAASGRLGARALLLAPTMLPLFVYPAIALLIAGLWGRPHAFLAAILWMAAGTTDLDVVRGTGLLPALWPAPAVGLAVAGALALVLAVSRWVPRPRAAVLAGSMVAVSAAVVVGTRTTISPAELPGVLLFDAAVWVVLGLIGLWSRRDPAALGLSIGGMTALVAASAGLADAVVAVALYRAGLVLAATAVVVDAAERAGGGLRLPLPRGRSWSADGAAVRGGIVAVCLAGSFVTWWDPPRMDSRVTPSLEPIGASVAQTMDWIRNSTDPAGVFIAGEDYAEAVAVLGGRRVLRAPTLLTAEDDPRRIRTGRGILSGRRVDLLLDRYDVRYVLIAHGQFRDHRLSEPWGIESAGFPLRFETPGGIRVYELPRSNALVP